MTRNRLVLPSLAMPWGRWIESEMDSTAAAIAREEMDADSAGSRFASRAELIRGQIAGITSVTDIQQRTVIPQQISRFTNPQAIAYVYTLNPQTFNPPRPDRAYDFTVIAAMNGSGVAMPYSRSIMRLNGVEFMMTHENGKPSEFSRATYSIAGTGRIDPGQTVSAEAGIISQSTGTMTLSATLWCVFAGSLT